jgi:heme o synthase
LGTFTFRSFLALTRYKVSVAVTFSALSSFILCKRNFTTEDLLPVAGILLLASGASALNQCQEREYDARMPRTMHRPLPAEEITPKKALGVALFMLIAGLIFIAARGLWITFGLGIFNVLWYNGLYTLLKRKTAFAVVPGALTGAIPVLMGWTSAGGPLLHPIPLFLAFFIFLWQVPHFWILSILHEKDYRNAEFPVLTGVFSQAGMKRVIFSWLLGASLSSILILLAGMIREPLTGILVVALNIALLALSAFHLFVKKKVRYRLLFLLINLFMLMVFAVIIIDNLL